MMVGTWFQEWSKVRETSNLDDFTKGLCERFGERGMMDIVEEFNRLKQEGTVVEALVTKYQLLTEIHTANNARLEGLEDGKEEKEQVGIG